MKTRFVFNYTSNNRIIVKDYKGSQSEKRILLQQSIVDISEFVRSSCLNKKFDYEKISFSDQFESIGYGFISILLKKKAPYSLLLEIDP